MTRSRRDLTAHDMKLWRHVTRSVSAYHPHDFEDDDEEDDKPAVKTKTAPPPSSPRSAPQQPLSPLAVGRTADMDRRQAQRLKRGDLLVDARLDLHGLTLDHAHSALTSFVRNAYARGARLVMVVTGKGVAGRGRIRGEAPHWLNQADVRPMILAVTEARANDGGSGALYVLLKRNKRGE